MHHILLLSPPLIPDLPETAVSSALRSFFSNMSYRLSWLDVSPDIGAGSSIQWLRLVWSHVTALSDGIVVVLPVRDPIGQMQFLLPTLIATPATTPVWILHSGQTSGQMGQLIQQLEHEGLDLISTATVPARTNEVSLADIQRDALRYLNYCESAKTKRGSSHPQ